MKRTGPPRPTDPVEARGRPGVTTSVAAPGPRPGATSAGSRPTAARAGPLRVTVYGSEERPTGGKGRHRGYRAPGYRTGGSGAGRTRPAEGGSGGSRQRDSYGSRPGEADGRGTARGRGPRPGAGAPPDRPARGQGSAAGRTPNNRSRAGSAPREGGRDRASGSARGRNEDRSDRSQPRSGGGRPWAGRDEATARGPRAAYQPRPQVPDSISAQQLDSEARAQLNSLPNDLADSVARYLVAAGLAEDPERAYGYAQAAKRLAARVGVVREACGIAAYQTGRWAEALSELRAARRMTGRDDYLPVMADCERALGRLDRALALVREAKAGELGRAMQIELRIVESGIRRDQGLPEAAIMALQVPELTSGAAAAVVRAALLRLRGRVAGRRAHGGGPRCLRPGRRGRHRWRDRRGRPPRRAGRHRVRGPGRWAEDLDDEQDEDLHAESSTTRIWRRPDPDRDDCRE